MGKESDHTGKKTLGDRFACGTCESHFRKWIYEKLYAGRRKQIIEVSIYSYVDQWIAQNSTLGCVKLSVQGSQRANIFKARWSFGRLEYGD